MRRLGAAALPVGTALIVAGLSMFHAQHASPAYDYVSSFRFTWSIAYMALLMVSAYAAGLPDVPRRRRQVVGSSVMAAMAGAAGVSVAQLALGSPLLPRLVVFGSALLVVPWFMICAALSAVARHAEEDRDRVVVVGEGEDASALAAEISRSAERPASLEAVIAPAEARQGPRQSMPLVDLVSETRATVVVLDRTAQIDQTIVEQAARLHASGVRVRTLSLFYDEWLAKLPIGELERVSMMFDIGEIHRQRYGRAKRVVDVAVAATVLPALLAIAPLVWLANLVGNRGPLLFKQRRIGKGGSEFTMWKFRTMRSEPDESGVTEWTGVDDPRITRFGNFLRRTHLDELPQLMNILRGDLSLVGPRPEQPVYVDELTTKLPFYEMRHMVQPGLTGWAQVKFGYAASDSDALEKLQYEFWYLRHQSLAVDARIMTRTLRSVLGGDGR